MALTALTGRRRQIAADLLCAGILLSLCLCIGLARWRSGLDLMDEGFLAYGGVQVTEGQVPHRDFVSLQPPLSFYTVAAAFKLFGTSLVSMRILGLGIYLLIPLLAYGIARNLNGSALSLAAAIPSAVLGISFFNFVPFAVWQGITAAMAAVWLYFRAARDGGRWRLAAVAGVMTAASIFFRQDQGLYGVLAIAAYTWALKWSRQNPARIFFAWLAGVAAGVLLLGIYFLARGAGPEMFRQLVAFPLTTYAKTSSLPFPRFDRSAVLAENLIVGLYYLPPLIQMLMALWLWRRRRIGNWGTQEAGISFILVWSVFYYCQALTRVDKRHLIITLVPFFILCACGWGATKARQGWTIAAAGVMTLFLLLTKPVFLPDESAFEEIRLPRAGVRAEGGAAMADFVRNLQAMAPASRSMLCLPYEPMFYFLCERRNPTRWNYLWEGDQTSEEHRTLIQEARHDPPALVLVNQEPELRRYAPAILDYVHADFQKAGSGSGFTIYRAR